MRYEVIIDMLIIDIIFEVSNISNDHDIWNYRTAFVKSIDSINLFIDG